MLVSPVQEHANKFNTALLRSREAREQPPCRTSRREGRSRDREIPVPDNISVRSVMPCRPAVPRRMTKGRMRIWKMAGAAVIVLLFIYIAIRLADVFLRARAAPARTESAATESLRATGSTRRVFPN